MAKPEDFTPQFFHKHNIDALQISIDTLHCNARCVFCYLPPVLKTMNGDTRKPLHQDPEAQAMMKAIVIGYVRSRKGQQTADARRQGLHRVAQLRGACDVGFRGSLDG